MMPGLSGYDVCRMVRRDYGFSIPIIMVSANSSQTQVRLFVDLVCLAKSQLFRAYLVRQHPVRRRYDPSFSFSVQLKVDYYVRTL